MKRQFTENRMPDKYGSGDSYDTPPGAKMPFSPSLSFYLRLLAGPLRWLCRRAAQNRCDDAAWAYSSAWCADLLEEAGCRLWIRGLANIDAPAGPCVFIANHMSTLETFILPGIVRPRRPVTFVVKNSLVKMPFFGPVMRSRDPVVVGRVNPREDLATVLNGGAERLRRGVSIIVFPQSTRTLEFSEEHFNSIGVKLARRANVPIVPVALKTDTWGQGAKIKELGKIRPDLPARFEFAAPMSVEDNGKKEHAEICNFISQRLAEWRVSDGVNPC